MKGRRDKGKLGALFLKYGNNKNSTDDDDDDED